MSFEPRPFNFSKALTCLSEGTNCCIQTSLPTLFKMWKTRTTHHQWLQPHQACLVKLSIGNFCLMENITADSFPLCFCHSFVCLCTTATFITDNFMLQFSFLWPDKSLHKSSDPSPVLSAQQMLFFCACLWTVSNSNSLHFPLFKM